jgi:hypothetical protein
MALVLGYGSSAAQNLDFTSSAQDLEMSFVSNIIEYGTRNPGGWQDIQNSLMCCGYADTQELSSSSSSLNSFIEDVMSANHVASGAYCSASACAAGDVDGSSSGSIEGSLVVVGASMCPVNGASWCRDALLVKVEAHAKNIGIIGVFLGAVELLHVLLSLLTLFRDVRTLRRRSPEVEIPRHPLAPVVGVTLITSDAQKVGGSANDLVNPE